MTQIKKHIDTITAVLVLANGTVPRVTVGTAHALSILSAILPKSSTKNIAFMSTNVSSPLHWTLSGATIPDILSDAPRFLLNNPIALQRKYLELRDDPNMKTRMLGFRDAVQASEQDAWEMLVHLFDWLDGLGPQKLMEIVPLCKEHQNIKPITHAPMDRAAVKKANGSAVGFTPGGHQAIEQYHRWGSDVDQKSVFNPHPEQRRQGMREEGTRQEPLGMKRGSLEQIKQMTTNLRLLRKAKEKVQKGLRKVVRIFN